MDEFFDLVSRHDGSFEYTVAWVDCLANGRRFARGHFIVGNHADDGELRWYLPGNLSIPINPPFSVINPYTLRAFNAAVYYGQGRRKARRFVSYEAFLFPLDSGRPTPIACMELRVFSNINASCRNQLPRWSSTR